MELICSKAACEWKVHLLLDMESIGIISSMMMLEAAKSEYLVPVDVDDLITPGALLILAHEINRLARAVLVYTDEDLLVDSKPASPYLRAKFDPVLALDNSTIWHLYAIKRDAALAADVYGDTAANWCQEWNTVYRMFYACARIEHTPKVLYHWRQRPGFITNNMKGASRSLDSVHHILERHIAHTATLQRFYVSEWPESPWIDQLASYGGPCALALKIQSVATAGNSLAFFRISALARAGVWPMESHELSSDMVIQPIGRRASNGWTVAFSPLVRARAGLSFRCNQSRSRPPACVPGVSHALARYGLNLNYRN